MCLLLETLGLHYSGGGAGLAQDTRAGRERPLCVVLNLLHQWFKDHPGCLPVTRPQLHVSEEWSASMGVGQTPPFACVRISIAEAAPGGPLFASNILYAHSSHLHRYTALLIEVTQLVCPQTSRPTHSVK